MATESVPRAPRSASPGPETLAASSFVLQTRVTVCPARANRAAVAPPIAPGPITTKRSHFSCMGQSWGRGGENASESPSAEGDRRGHSRAKVVQGERKIDETQPRPHHCVLCHNLSRVGLDVFLHPTGCCHGFPRVGHGHQVDHRRCASPGDRRWPGRLSHPAIPSQRALLDDPRHSPDPCRQRRDHDCRAPHRQLHRRAARLLDTDRGCTLRRAAAEEAAHPGAHPRRDHRLWRRGPPSLQWTFGGLEPQRRGAHRPSRHTLLGACHQPGAPFPRGRGQHGEQRDPDALHWHRQSGHRADHGCLPP